MGQERFDFASNTLISCARFFQHRTAPTLFGFKHPVKDSLDFGPALIHSVLWLILRRRFVAEVRFTIEPIDEKSGAPACATDLATPSATKHCIPH